MPPVKLANDFKVKIEEAGKEEKERYRSGVR